MTILIKYKVRKLTLTDERKQKLPFIVYDLPDRAVERNRLKSFQSWVVPAPALFIFFKALPFLQLCC